MQPIVWWSHRINIEEPRSSHRDFIIKKKLKLIATKTIQLKSQKLWSAGRIMINIVYIEMNARVV